NGRYSWGVGRGPFAAFRLDKSEAWVGGAELIAHTVDGGATWEITPLWPAVIFTRELIGLTDRGPLGVHGLHFHDRDQGLMLVTADDVKDGGTNGAAVLATHDGGHTWEQRAVSRRPPPNNFIGDSLSMASASLGWMTHRLGTLYVTTDSGATWRGTGYGVRRAHVAADGNVWATTAEGASDEPVYLARSSDLGQTWEPATVAADLPEEFSSHGGLSSLTLPQDGRGWAVGAFGVVLATEDGATWTREDTPTTSRLLDVQYVEGVVYATGEDGVVLKRDAASTAVHATAKRPTTWARTKAGQRRDGSR
ncbi:hypothetical protein HOI71_26680, partial [Candidatus Poribacteria bacterium]|nr:hypothetical protein [Candidatus Poribacteria bacterium]